MNIGVPKERRPFEYRVGMTPAGVNLLTNQGHVCYVEHDAGLGAGFSDKEYETAGGKVVYTPHEVFGRADLLLKVARPVVEEIEWLRQGTALAGLLHLASARQEKIDALLKNEITAIAYEHIELADGTMPVRLPLSQIGGMLAAQTGARLLQNDYGGKGILISGAPGVAPAEVLILGAGVVGTWAARAFHQMNAHITVLDTNLTALQQMYETIPDLVTMISTPVSVARALSYADIVVGAVFVPNQRPPIVVNREMLRLMKPRSVVIDVSIDEGGCIETSRPTTHEHSTFIEEGIIHYCVPNMPSIVARTSTYAYLNAALPYVFELANKGVDAALEENKALELGVMTRRGETVHLLRLAPAYLME